MKTGMTGIDLIAQERRRQIEEEGFTAQHDVQHRPGELVTAAVCYANEVRAMLHVCGYTLPTPRMLSVYSALPPASFWPWAEKWWKPKDPLRDLVRAGALIAAEIDRLQRNQK